MIDNGKNGEVTKKKEAHLHITHRKKVVFKQIPHHLIGKRIGVVYNEIRGLPNLVPHRIVGSWKRDRLPDGLIVGRLVVFFDAPIREYTVNGQHIKTLQAFLLNTRGVPNTPHLSFEREVDEKMCIAIYE